MFVVDAKILRCLETKDGVGQNGKPWLIRSYLAEYQDGDVSKEFLFQTFGDSVVIEVGKTMQLSCDVRAREWNGKYYNTVRCYKAFADGKPQYNENNNKPKPNVMPSPITVDANGRRIDETPQTPAQNNASGGVSANDLPF